MGIRRRHRIALGRVQAVEKFCHVIHRGGIVAACRGFGRADGRLDAIDAYRRFFQHLTCDGVFCIPVSLTPRYTVCSPVNSGQNLNKRLTQGWSLTDSVWTPRGLSLNNNNNSPGPAHNELLIEQTRRLFAAFPVMYLLEPACAVLLVWLYWNSGIGRIELLACGGLIAAAAFVRWVASLLFKHLSSESTHLDNWRWGATLLVWISAALM